MAEAKRRCEGLTKGGKLCRADALRGSPFCGHHGMTADGKPLVRPTSAASKWARHARHLREES